MPKLIPYILLTFLALSTITSCRKVYDYIRDHPDGHDSVCRVIRLSFGSPDTNHLNYGTPQIGITYNAKGNPVDMDLLNILPPYYALAQHFRYDRFDRLTDYISNYTGGPDPIPYKPSAVLWHKYGYPRPNIITDTFFTYTSTPWDAPPPNAEPGQTIYVYKFDAAGKMIATAETTNSPNQPPPAFAPIAYDARGNKDLSGYGVKYDSAVNVYRTNKVWQLVYGDYSRNNPTRTGTSPTNQFGLPTYLPMFDLAPVPSFRQYFTYSYDYYIYYACAMPKGPTSY